MLRRRRKLLIALALLLLVAGVAVWYWWTPLWIWSRDFWAVISNRETFRQRMESYGAWGPLVFMSLQFLQVLAAPIPGELTGAAGGYIFGWWQGLIYSTIGLTLGSLNNFFLARIFGKTLVERLVPPDTLSRVGFLMERQGVIASFILFVIPGFPKDYLCVALGLTPLNWRIFLLICGIGRLPGTLLLSLQGAMVYQENYWSFAILLVLALAFVIPVIVWREKIYQLLYHLDKRRGPLEP